MKWDWNEALRVAGEESYEEGYKIGYKKGLLLALVNLVNKDMISLTDAAKKAGLSVDEFKKATSRL
jgi:predicted HTH domain antitoxin